VAPACPLVGAFLPYTPLHHLLLREVGRPLMATSGNPSDEPICTDEGEALRRLGEIADLFLVHDQPIARPVDDSVVQVVLGEVQILRRARGYAPLHLPCAGAKGVLAVGAYLKNTVALGLGRQAVLGPHVGDLDTSLAQEMGLPRTGVQHHYAHALSCLAEHGHRGPILAVAWDGTGYGPDGTVKGGKFLAVEDGAWRRAGHLRPFPLLGGEAAGREPRRAALGLLFAL